MEQGMLARMLSWPNTPTSQQLTRATETFRKTGQPQSLTPDDDGAETATVIRDVLILSACYSSTHYRQWAFQTFRHRKNEAHDPVSLMGLFSYLAWSGETEMLIGIALREDTPKPPDMSANCNFGQIPRHPQWMGFAPIWSKVRDLQALVAESHSKPGQPGSLIVLPKDEIWDDGIPHNPFPDGEATLIKTLLDWHGAAQSTWVPSQLTRWPTSN